MAALLHFVPDDDDLSPEREAQARDVYRQQTATPVKARTRAEAARFVTGMRLVEPGVVSLPEWRPAPGDPTDFAANPGSSGFLAAVGQVQRGQGTTRS